MKLRIVMPILVVTAVLGCQRKETRAPVSEMQQGETKANVSSASTATEAAVAASFSGADTPSGPAAN